MNQISLDAPSNRSMCLEEDTEEKHQKEIKTLRETKQQKFFSYNLYRVPASLPHHRSKNV
jgi:hypothetical protein